MILPAWTIGNVILYGWLTLMAISIGPLEYNGLAMMQYSKFRAEQGVPSRLGMFIIYFLPLVALVIAGLPNLAHPTFVQMCVFGAVFIHFAKRTLESLFLHKYSGPLGLFTMLMITGFYSLAAFMIGYVNRQPLQDPDIWFYLGAVLFVIGIIGNFIHHKILADLRGSTSEYVIPRGGLFDLVACPHYLFEIITWVGIVLLSHQLVALLSFGFMAAYLTARSLRTLAWYRTKFPNFPADRKALFPFVL